MTNEFTEVFSKWYTKFIEDLANNKAALSKNLESFPGNKKAVEDLINGKNNLNYNTDDCKELVKSLAWNYDNTRTNVIVKVKNAL